MSRVLTFPDHRLEQGQASVWIARLDRGLRGAERVQLRRWLAQNARHREALFDAARLWDRMDMLAELAELFPLQDESNAGRWRAAWRPAALLMVLAGLAVAFFDQRLHRGREVPAAALAVARLPVASAVTPAPPPATFAASYTTAIGEQRIVNLPDHSIIQLNTNTSLRVEFTANGRLLKMARGEANFQVAKDPARLFTVRVAGFDFNAIGTAFDIRADWPQGVRLTVTEGRVRVHRAQALPAESVQAQASWSGLSDSTEVEANKEVVVRQSSERIKALEPAQVVTATAWQRGMVVFNATPLDQVLSELARYSTTRFVLVDSELGRVPVSGYFRIGDVDALAAALEHNFGINVEKNNNVILLSTRPSK